MDLYTLDQAAKSTVSYSNYIVPLSVVILVVLILLSILSIVKNNYIKISPNQAAVISGRKRKIGDQTVGYRLIKGGSAFVIPFLEKVEYLDLTTITIPNLEVKEVVTSKGVPVSVLAVANIKIGSEEVMLDKAVERLLGKSRDEVSRLAYQTLEGHLRAILGILTVEEAYSDRAKFGAQIITESQADLSKLGLKIDILTIKEIKDTQGYLEALGKTRIAEVKRDAEVGSAEAQREATIKSTTSEKEGEVARQNNIALTAEAEKNKDVKIQEFKAQVDSQAAKAAQAGPLATAEERIKVVKKEAELAQSQADLKEKQLVTEVVKPAEAKKAATIVEAEAQSKAIQTLAEANKKKVILEGEAQSEALKLRLVAEADGKKAQLLAQAEGQRALLLAEAEGVKKKAEAYKELTEAGKLLQILETLNVLVPQSIEKLGPVMKEIAAPMANIDKVIVMDGGSGSSLNALSSQVPKTLFNLFESLKASGFDFSDLLKKAGVTLDSDASATKQVTRNEK